MLTKEENDRLTQVGPATPMGKLLRWYWHPVTATAQLVENPVQRIRILGEDLVLFQDRSANLGLIGERCAHRATGLWYGIPDADGLRCPYHGWKYDAAGQCLDQPLEPPGRTFKDRIKIKAYPVQEMGGLIWAYLGEPPVPALPRWEQFVKPNTFRHIGATVLPCNWLQCLENGGDPTHGIYLHGYFYQWVIERLRAQGRQPPPEDIQFAESTANARFQEIRAEPFEFGMRKWVRLPGEAEWEEHKLVIFPYMRGDQIGVPIDDTHTWHIIYLTYTPSSPGVEVPQQDVVPFFEAPFADDMGNPLFDYITAQDHMAWWSQGDITDRTQEHLAYTDAAVIAYRKLLAEQLGIVEEGGEPMNVFRDSDAREMLPMRPARRDVFAEGSHYMGQGRRGGGGGLSQPRWITDTARYSPVYGDLMELYRKDVEARASR